MLQALIDLMQLLEKIFLKAEVDKLGINKLVKVPNSLNNVKTKVDDLDVGKLKTAPIDLKNLSHVVNEVVKNTKFNTLQTKENDNLEKKIPDATKLIQRNQCITDKQILEKKMPMLKKKQKTDTNDLVTTTVLNTKINEFENKILDASGLVFATVLNTK